jgi:tetratricopeptide (TPR) repeat protein
LTIALLGFLAADFFAFGSSLQFGFLVNSDDQAYIYRNPYLQNLTPANVFAMFTHVHFDSYLPLTLVSYSLDYTLWGFNPFGYHLTQILLHGFNSFLVFRILVRAGMSPAAAFCSALLFSVHPVQTESVAWISERKNLLSGFFIFLSLWFYLGHVADGDRSRRDYWLSWTAFVFALLSKAVAVMLPAVLLVYDLCIARRGLRLREKIPFFAAAVLAAGATLFTQGSVGAIKAYAGGSPALAALYVMRVYWDYCADLVLPLALLPQYFYGFDTLTDWRSWLSWVLVPGALVAVVRRWRTHPALAFAVAWCVLWLLPVSNIVPLATLRQDRYLYLPVLALAVGAMAALLRAGSDGKNPRLYGWVMAAVLAASFALLARNHTEVYASDRAYWRPVAERYPQWSEAQYNVGRQCWLSADTSCAVEYYKRAVRAKPQNTRALNNLGAVLIDLGDYRSALPYIELALKMDPESPDALANRILLAEKTGADADRVPEWQRALERAKSRDKKDHYRLGEFRMRR